MPFPIMAVLGLVASKIAADQAAKQAAAQSAVDAANKPKPDPINMQPVTLEDLDRNLGGDDDPYAGEGFGDGALPTGADSAGTDSQFYGLGEPPASAHARTLQDINRPTKALAGPPITDDGLQPSGGEQIPQVPQEDLSDGGGKMTGMEMAQLGLMLGSMLGKKQPGPPIPGLPGGGGAPAMKPVFRG